MHPILKQLLDNYRIALEDQLKKYADDALAHIAVTDSEIDRAQEDAPYKRNYNYYALIISSNDGVFLSPVVGVKLNEDGTTTGWICLLRDYVEPFAKVCAQYPDDTLQRGLSEITAISAASRIYNDEIYDQDYEFEDADCLQGGTVLLPITFTLSDRFQPRSAVAYEYFELNDGMTTWREYLCSYIIITQSELTGIYSSVDL